MSRATFDALLADRQRAPFCWGRNDCCLFTADAVLALTGIDHAAAWRGTYTSAHGAAAVLKRLGGVRSLGELAGPPIAPLAARVGDVGVLVHAGRDLLAVCAGEQWVCPGRTGLAAYALDAAIAAWRVDHA